MANKLDLVQQTDVTFWGVGAMVFGAVAVLSTSLTALLPQSLWVGLHSNRISGGNLNQLRAEVTQLREQQIQMRRQATQLRGRLVIAERGRGDVSQRVGALETAIPMLLEVVPPGAEIDRTLFTASIDGGDVVNRSFETEGGSVTLTRRPLAQDSQPGTPAQQALPAALGALPSAPPLSIEPSLPASVEIEAIIPNQDFSGVTGLVEEDGAGSIIIEQTLFGIALGGEVSVESAGLTWVDVSRQLGTLLLGLQPAVSDPLQNGSFRIVAGPIDNYSQAENLCVRVTKLGVDCLPVSYETQNATAL